MSGSCDSWRYQQHAWKQPMPDTTTPPPATDPSPEAHDADAERLAEIDDKITARRANLGGWMLSHSDGVFLRERLDTAVSEIAIFSHQAGKALERERQAIAERDTALRDADVLREFIKSESLWSVFLDFLDWQSRKEVVQHSPDECRNSSEPDNARPPSIEAGAEALPTKSLRHPLTGDTVVVSTETGRILETRPAASGEDVERASPKGWHILLSALRECDPSPSGVVGHELEGAIETAITAARLSGRAAGFAEALEMAAKAADEDARVGRDDLHDPVLEGLAGVRILAAERIALAIRSLATAPTGEIARLSEVGEAATTLTDTTADRTRR